MSRPASDWTNGIVPPARRGAALRLFCFPHAGGGASAFQFCTTELAPEIEVYPIQLPGRGGRWREPPITSISALVPALDEAVGPLLDPPYAFFGHSLGSYIAFEWARHLRREGRLGPAALIVSAAHAPQIPDPNLTSHLMPEEQLLEELRRFDGIPRELLDSPELIALMLPTLRADLTMCETYAYGDEPPLACHLLVYGGERDAKVSPEYLLPWKVQASGAFRLRMFPGNHFFLFKEARAAVVQALREDLWRYARGTVGPDGLTPRAHLERVIADVWSEVLSLPHVAVDDNFFDLGGNSVQIVMAYAKLREVLSTKLSVLDLFRYPTVRLLASAVASAVELAGGGSAGGGFADTPAAAAHDKH